MRQPGCRKNKTHLCFWWLVLRQETKNQKRSCVLRGQNFRGAAMTKSYVTKCLRTRFPIFEFLLLFTFLIVLFLFPQNVYSLEATLTWGPNSEKDLVCKIPLLHLTLLHKIPLIIVLILWAINRLVTCSDYFVRSFHFLFRVNRRFKQKEIKIERREPRDVITPCYLPEKSYQVLFVFFFATCLVRCAVPVKIPFK